MRCRRFAAALLAAACVPAPTAHALDRSCHPAADVLDAALLSGPWHTVEPCVRVVGHLYRFTLATDWGLRTVESRELVAIRVEELAAEAALRALGTPELGVRAFGARGHEHGRRIARAAREPGATIAGLPRGVLAFFERRVSRTMQRLRKHGDRARDGITGADDVYDAPSARVGVAASPSGPRRGTAARAGRELERQVRSELSFHSTRRRWAARLGIDPHTGNEPLRDELERITRAAIVGEASADAAIALLPASLVAALDALGDVDAYVWTRAPEDVAASNAARLVAFGCGELEARRAMRNGAFAPRLQTALVDALEALEPRERCDELVDLAAALRGELEARYLVNALAMLDRWAPDTASRRLELVGTSPVARLESPGSRGTPELLVPLAVDRLQWTAATRRWFDQPALRAEHRVALILGDASPRAARELARRGWSVVERAVWATP